MPVRLVSSYLVTGEDHRDALRSWPVSANQRLHIEMSTRQPGPIRALRTFMKVANQPTVIRFWLHATQTIPASPVEYQQSRASQGYISGPESGREDGLKLEKVCVFRWGLGASADEPRGSFPLVAPVPSPTPFHPSWLRQRFPLDGSEPVRCPDPPPLRPSAPPGVCHWRHRCC